jgi:sulfur relay (sulfurtransferase) DsrF/TusC family protein
LDPVRYSTIIIVVGSEEGFRVIISLTRRYDFFFSVIENQKEREINAKPAEAIAKMSETYDLYVCVSVDYICTPKLLEK